MIFAIGDIHGLLDPLKNLILTLEENYKIDKLIFLGDYIDSGPNSKEVIDYLIDLPYEKVFLMGNHDDLLLQYFNEDFQDQYFTDDWWLEKNDGYRTIQSFSGNAKPEKLANGKYCSSIIGKKYMTFFENLKYVHEEIINNKKYLFTHAYASINKDFPIEKVFEVNKFDLFHNYINENTIFLGNSVLWNRHLGNDNFEKLNDYIVIHAHIPTAHIDEVPNYVVKNKLPFIECGGRVIINEHSDGYDFSLNLNNFYGINIDTGAVTCDALSALGFIDDLEFVVVQSRMDQWMKNNNYKKIIKYKINKK